MSVSAAVSLHSIGDRPAYVVDDPAGRGDVFGGVTQDEPPFALQPLDSPQIAALLVRCEVLRSVVLDSDLQLFQREVKAGDEMSTGVVDLDLSFDKDANAVQDQPDVGLPR